MSDSQNCIMTSIQIKKDEEKLKQKKIKFIRSRLMDNNFAETIELCTVRLSFLNMIFFMILGIKQYYNTYYSIHFIYLFYMNIYAKHRQIVPSLILYVLMVIFTFTSEIRIRVSTKLHSDGLQGQGIFRLERQ